MNNKIPRDLIGVYHDRNGDNKRVYIVRDHPLTQREDITLDPAIIKCESIKIRRYEDGEYVIIQHDGYRCYLHYEHCHTFQVRGEI